MSHFGNCHQTCTASAFMASSARWSPWQRSGAHQQPTRLAAQLGEAGQEGGVAGQVDGVGVACFIPIPFG